MPSKLPQKAAITPAQPSLNLAAIEALLDRAFEEDLSDIGDITAQSILKAEDRLSAMMNARETLTVAGLPVAVAAFKRFDPDCSLTLYAKDGDRLKAGSPILKIEGQARALLIAERTALNIVQHLSGIASLTARYVEALEGLKTQLLDTRKTHAGLRLFEKYAVAMGGGLNHRMGLYDAVMIKDNHLAVVGSVYKAVKAAQAAGHRSIQVECDHIEQALEAIEAGADRLLLDNMSPALLKEALEKIKGRALVEASGGVTLQTIRAIAETDVDFISVGRLTQSAPAIDIGLDFSRPVPLC